MFRDLDVFALPAAELVRRMGELTSIEADPDDPASFTAPNLLLSFWPAGPCRRCRCCLSSHGLTAARTHRIIRICERQGVRASPTVLPWEPARG